MNHHFDKAIEEEFNNEEISSLIERSNMLLEEIMGHKIRYNYEA